MRYVVLVVPAVVAVYVIYKLNQIMTQSPDYLKMTPERRRLLIRAGRDDPMRLVRGEELS